MLRSVPPRRGQPLIKERHSAQAEKACVRMVGVSPTPWKWGERQRGKQGTKDNLFSVFSADLLSVWLFQMLFAIFNPSLNRQLAQSLPAILVHQI